MANFLIFILFVALFLVANIAFYRLGYMSGQIHAYRYCLELFEKLQKQLETPKRPGRPKTTKVPVSDEPATEPKND